MTDLMTDLEFELKLKMTERKIKELYYKDKLSIEEIGDKMGHIPEVIQFIIDREEEN